MEAVIVTGLSGAGKSNAMNYLEDMGYYCIDNMPPALLQSFITLEKQNRINMDKAAFVMDIRGREFFGDLVRVLEELKGAGKNVRVLFLEATDDALVRRFKETRRVHPLAEESGTNSEAIRRERELLKGVRENADLIINTTGLKPADLQNLLQTMLSGKEESDTFSITVQSFGYKHGMTMDADMVFDARFIPNPYYLKSMKHPTGNNKKIRDYVMKFPETQDFIRKAADLIQGLIPYYIKQGKRTLVIAFGCTGGQHRSVAMANLFSEIFREQGCNVTTVHRDILKR